MQLSQLPSLVFDHGLKKNHLSLPISVILGLDPHIALLSRRVFQIARGLLILYELFSRTRF